MIMNFFLNQRGFRKKREIDTAIFKTQKKCPYVEDRTFPLAVFLDLYKVYGTINGWWINCFLENLKQIINISKDGI